MGSYQNRVEKEIIANTIIDVVEAHRTGNIIGGKELVTIRCEGDCNMSVFRYNVCITRGPSNNCEVELGELFIKALLRKGFAIIEVIK